MRHTNEYSIPPMANGPAVHTAQQLADTGATESHNTVALQPGRTAVLSVGDEAVRVSFRGVPGLAGAVGATDAIIPANTLFKFRTILNLNKKKSPPEVNFGSIYVYVEAADGASAYECTVWQDSE